ncbi:MAG: prolipoprotein diacylglyceryl transferase [Calditrichia bacterium]|nr:prolipoprotein diacylglyceryl transferase [Calditrichota bacterium]MCB9070402.1 prolipoprotein diacylglyceryl transferase [Calditrichia bacterium]
MYPELFRIGPVVVSSYGLMLATAFMVGMYLTTRLVRQRNMDEDAVVNLAFGIIISAIVGSRLLYVLTHLSEFEGRWQYTFLPIQPDGSIGLSGLIFLGGFIGAVITGYIYVRMKKLPVWKTADSVAPSLALGLAFGRIGCFLNGCCFGRACDLPWGVQFPVGSPATAFMGDVHLHPTQLYSSAYALLIFALLIWMNHKKMADGIMAGTFLVLYGLSRFTVDFFRYYESQMQVGPLYMNQVISIILILGGLLIIWQSRQKESAKSAITS